MNRYCLVLWIGVTAMCLILTTGAIAGPAATVVVEKGILAFSPSEVTIKKGQTIRFINHDIQMHFLASSKSSEKLSEEGNEVKTTQADLLLFKSLDPEEVYDKTISDVGTFFFYCGIHNKMFGKITVEE